MSFSPVYWQVQTQENCDKNEEQSRHRLCFKSTEEGKWTQGGGKRGTFSFLFDFQFSLSFQMFFRFFSLPFSRGLDGENQEETRSTITRIDIDLIQYDTKEAPQCLLAFEVAEHENYSPTADGFYNFFVLLSIRKKTQAGKLTQIVELPGTAADRVSHFPAGIEHPKHTGLYRPGTLSPLR